MEYAKFKKKLGTTIESTGMLVGLIAIYIFGHQIYLWFKNGSWEHVSLAVILPPFAETPFCKWLINPQDWLGLHRIVSWMFVNIPLALVIFLVAIPIVVWGQTIEEEAECGIESPKKEDSEYEEQSMFSGE